MRMASPHATAPSPDGSLPPAGTAGTTFPTQRPFPRELPPQLEGMDPNTTYVLEIKMLGNRKKTRKDVGCLLIDNIIDSDLINFNDFVESIVEEFPPRYLEVAHVQYYDEAMKNFPEVKSDQELMSMFSKYSESKFVHMFIQYCHPSDPFVPITEWEFDDHGQNDIEVEQDEEGDYLKNPCADNEHVGIDEEVMYLEGRDGHPLRMVVCSDEGKDRDGDEVEVEVEDESEDDVEDEVEEEDEVDNEVHHEANNTPIVDYDKNDPPMVVGTIYGSMDEFKIAICQHCCYDGCERTTKEKSKDRKIIHRACR